MNQAIHMYKFFHINRDLFASESNKRRTSECRHILPLRAHAKAIANLFITDLLINCCIYVSFPDNIGPRPQSAFIFADKSIDIHMYLGRESFFRLIVAFWFHFPLLLDPLCYSLSFLRVNQSIYTCT